MQLTVRDCHMYATFQSHNQKVVQNRNGVFLSYISRYDESAEPGRWFSRTARTGVPRSARAIRWTLLGHPLRAERGSRRDVDHGGRHAPSDSVRSRRYPTLLLLHGRSKRPTAQSKGPGRSANLPSGAANNSELSSRMIQTWLNLFGL